MMYPWAGNWYSDRAHQSVIHNYAQRVAQMPSAQVQQELQTARDYNKSLGTGGVVGDPNSDTTANANQADVQKYLKVLAFDPSGVMGTIAIPKIGVNLPIYHGTSADVL
ncbi:MAG: class C sortase, partial [Actinomycetia bacterium]|nr:class C sortase [Actinomycetes bacterium]